MAEELPDVEAKAAVRLNITVRSETKARLDEVRDKRKIEVNVSKLCDAAINAELDRREKPGIADVLERLRLESDRRRGAPYREGFLNGQRWAREIGSWGEICWYARLSEDDVQVEDRESSSDWGRYDLSFVGRFYAPAEDWPKAPGLRSEEVDLDGIPVLNQDPHYCDQFWRGWLAGVIDLHKAIAEDLEPIEPVAPTGSSFFTEEEVDPDEIPF